MSSRGSRGNSTLSGLIRTAKQFVKSKIGVIGAVIILFFVCLALLAPVITTSAPVTGFNVGAQYAVPAWAVIFPQYAKDSVGNTLLIPKTEFVNASDLSPWQVDDFKGSNYTLAISSENPHDSSAPGSGSLYVNATAQDNQTIASSRDPNPLIPYGQVLLEMSAPIQFNGKAPEEFRLGTVIDPLSMKDLSALYVIFIVETPTGNNYTLASIQGYSLESQIIVATPGQWKDVNISSSILADPDNHIPAFETSANSAGIVFTAAGTYHLIMQIQGVCSNYRFNSEGYSACPSNLSISALISPITLKSYGSAYGLLGTDSDGRSVWSQFVWGSQISLEVGILAAVGSVGLGTIAGVAGGYLGGLTDEVLGRVTDFVLVLPFLPLLIILVLILTRNPLFDTQIYLWIIVIFTVISWPGIARIIRSQVLSVKERPYVEASRALGGGTGHVLRKHIIPNVMGLVYSQMALSVSGFILTEAALDYLSVSVHPITTITWGIMLTNSLGDATTNSAHSYVWWWFLPPGIAIAALSLAFVLVGFALDSVFNPKLRAR